MSDELLGVLIAGAVVAVCVGGLVIASLRDDLKHARSRAREARDAVDALVELDPTLLAVFGRAQTWGDYSPVGAREGRVLDVDRLRRLAKTQSTLTKRATRSTELDEALAALAEARKDEE